MEQVMQDSRGVFEVHIPIMYESCISYGNITSYTRRKFHAFSIYDMFKSVHSNAKHLGLVFI